jgi:glyoxylase-like metal-dependent hydrolase (beta-lactamase superfamily II)
MKHRASFLILLISLLLCACSSDPGLDQAVEDRGNNTGNWWDALPRADWANYEQIETDYPWFEVYKIRDGILAIYEPGQFEEVISFLITGRDRALLFDTGLGMGDMAALIAQLTELPITVLNSHGHYDHVGGNYQFDAVLARTLPFTVEKSRGSSHEKVAEFASSGWIWKPHPPGFDPDTYQIKPYTLGAGVEEGQFIDLGGVSLEIIFAPGHAPDGIVLIDHQRRLMFTGDVFYPAPLYSHLAGSSFTDYVATASKLTAWADKVDYLLTSHNTPVSASAYLLKMDAAFQSIVAQQTSWEASDGGREYMFDGFSILTADPP